MTSVQNALEVLDMKSPEELVTAAMGEKVMYKIDPDLCFHPNQMLQG